MFHIGDEWEAIQHLLPQKAEEVRHSWVATIRPSFDPPALLAVTTTHHHAVGIFSALPAANGFPVAHQVKIFGSDWLDEVQQTLQSINLFDTEFYLTLDGIRYEVDIYTFSCQARIGFSNPQQPTLKRLETALQNTALAIMADVDNKPLQAYLNVWRKYIW